MSVYCVSYLSGKIGHFRTDNDSPITYNEKPENYSLRPILFDYISYLNISTVSCSSLTNYMENIKLETWSTKLLQSIESFLDIFYAFSVTKTTLYDPKYPTFVHLNFVHLLNVKLRMGRSYTERQNTTLSN